MGIINYYAVEYELRKICIYDISIALQDNNTFRFRALIYDHELNYLRYNENYNFLGTGIREVMSIGNIVRDLFPYPNVILKV